MMRKYWNLNKILLIFFPFASGAIVTWQEFYANIKEMNILQSNT